MTKNRVLILDDDPGRHDAFNLMLPDAQVFHTYTAGQAIRALKKNPTFDVVFLDHDLPKSQELVGVRDPGDGLQVATFIADQLDPSRIPHQIVIHSWNKAGSRAMARALKKTDCLVTQKRFSTSMTLS